MIDMSDNTDRFIDMMEVQLNWTLDIVKRVDIALKSSNNDKDKLEIIAWLIKQALKVEREE
jgi:hypothetical protein